MSDRKSGIGISMAYLQDADFSRAAATFLGLQSEFALDVCEVHLEGIQFAAGFCRPSPEDDAALARIRGRVKILGFHLPYLDLNPVSADSEITGFAMARFRQAIGSAADSVADYVVFHARGRRSPDSLRSSDLDCWREVLEQLTDWAADRGVAFCVENADDLRSVGELLQLAPEAAPMRFCLDIGHLFERLELASGWERVAARLWDRYLPWSAVAGKGLPFFAAGGMPGCLDALGERLYCVHVHNHDGTLAHCALTEGKVDMRAALRPVAAAGIPVILEADYRRRDMATIRNDLKQLKGWMS